jgi:hypothetical protein
MNEISNVQSLIELGYYDPAKDSIINATEIANNHKTSEREVLARLPYHYKIMRIYDNQLFAIFDVTKKRAEPAENKAYYNIDEGVHIPADGKGWYRRQGTSNYWSYYEDAYELLSVSDLVPVGTDRGIVSVKLKCITTQPLKITGVNAPVITNCQTKPQILSWSIISSAGRYSQGEALQITNGEIVTVQVLMTLPLEAQAHLQEHSNLEGFNAMFAIIDKQESKEVVKIVF